MSNVIMAFVSVVNAAPGGVTGLKAGQDATGGTAVLPAARSRSAAKQLIRPLAAAALIGGASVLRRRLLSWGATDDEQQRVLAGDDLLPMPDVCTTRSITITAHADDIWPWLAQLGQGRGGFYSYDRLENLVARIDIHNADRIVPQWQHVAVGAEVRLAPEVPLTVAGLDQGRALVLRGSVPMGRVAPPYEFTWAFVLLPQSDGTTRLVVRERYTYSRRWAALIVQPATLVSCLMTPKMLRGIKSRVEGSLRPPGPKDGPVKIAAPGHLSAEPIAAAR